MRSGIKWSAIFLISLGNTAMAIAGWDGAEMRYGDEGDGFVFPSPLMHRTQGPHLALEDGALWKVAFFFR